MIYETISNATIFFVLFQITVCKHFLIDAAFTILLKLLAIKISVVSAMSGLASRWKRAWLVAALSSAQHHATILGSSPKFDIYLHCSPPNYRYASSSKPRGITFFPSICLYYALPSRVINDDNKEIYQKESKQKETTKIVPLRGMKEIKKRASDDIHVKNVRNVRNRTMQSVTY
jgi:hypothetical protein